MATTFIARSCKKKMLATFAVVVALLIVRRLWYAHWRTGTRGSVMRRFTAFVPKDSPRDKPMVLFLIGTRLNSWWALLTNLPVFMRYGKAAGPNFVATGRDNSYGCLYQRQWGDALDFLFGDGVMTVQYWRSMDDLSNFNKEKDHMASRKQYYNEMEQAGIVSIWHETYLIQPGSYECVWGNSHPIGLAAVPGVTIVPINTSTSRYDTAMARLKAGAPD